MSNLQVISSSKSTRAPSDIIDASLFPRVNISSTGSVSINGSMENIEFLLNEYGIDCQFNLLTREEEISADWIRSTPDNQANTAIQYIINLCINNNVPKMDAVGHLKAIADRRAYNPIGDWISETEWDGKDRLSQVINAVEVNPGYEEVRDIYLRKWFMCAVGMLNNGMNGEILDYEGILVFQGAQGIGKTSWFKGLVDRKLQHLVRDGLELDLNSKDSRMTFSSHWLVELGELDATFKKSEISALKAFTTMASDKIRRPYDRVDTILYRRTVMFASVNDEQFLQDSTGNRRFWCLPVTGLSLPEGFEPQQFWAQVKVELDKEGGPIAKPWFVTGEDAAKRDLANSLFAVSDPMMESMMIHFDIKSSDRSLRGPATAYCNLIGIMNPNRGQVANMGRVCKDFKFETMRTSTQRFIAAPMPTGVTSEMLRDCGFERKHGDAWVKC